MFIIKQKFSASCGFSLAKSFCTKAVKNRIKGLCDFSAKKPLGQPTSYTHPHLLGENEVTPMIKREEYQCRRQKLVEAIVQHAKQKGSKTQNHMCLQYFSNST